MSWSVIPSTISCVMPGTSAVMSIAMSLLPRVEGEHRGVRCAESTSTALPRAGYSRAMSQENVEIVRSAFEDFGQGDMASLMAKVDPDIVIVQPRELGGATQRGHAGVHEVFALWPEQWDNYEATITNTIDVGEQVVVAVRTTGR